MLQVGYLTRVPSFLWGGRLPPPKQEVEGSLGFEFRASRSRWFQGFTRRSDWIVGGVYSFAA